MPVRRGGGLLGPLLALLGCLAASHHPLAAAVVSPPSQEEMEGGGLFGKPKATVSRRKATRPSTVRLPTAVSQPRAVVHGVRDRVPPHTSDFAAAFTAAESAQTQRQRENTQIKRALAVEVKRYSKPMHSVLLQVFI